MGNISSFTLFKRYPILLALFAQILALFILRNFLKTMEIFLSPWTFTFLQAMMSALISLYFFKLPKWFLSIAILLPFCFLLVFSYSALSQSFWGIGFAILALTFSHTLRERVPLYLSNKTTHATLKKIVDERHVQKVLDLGSGLGGVVRFLSSNSIESKGVESAPLLWLISTFLSKFSGKGEIVRQNIWSVDLGQYDMVYAFLSPAVMEKLYEKIKIEMKPGSFFVSNSFAIPNRDYDELWVLSDERETQLYFYEIK